MENNGYGIGTGFLSTPFILPMLTEAARADVAYKMLENDESPSWIAEVKAGATTVWEHWYGEGNNNYYSPGSVISSAKTGKSLYPILLQIENELFRK